MMAWPGRRSAGAMLVIPERSEVRRVRLPLPVGDLQDQPAARREDVACVPSDLAHEAEPVIGLRTRDRRERLAPIDDGGIGRVHVREVRVRIRASTDPTASSGSELQDVTLS